MIQKIAGIYTITNKVNGKIYVGSSKNVFARLRTHKQNIKNKTHENRLINNDLLIYGVSSFEFELLEKCSESFLHSLECFWINQLNTTNDNYGYNLASVNPVTGKSIFTNSAKEMVSKSKKGSNNPNYKKVFTQAERDIISKRFSKGNHHFAKKVKCLNTNKEWDCCLSASIELGYKHSTLRAMLNGSRINKTTLIYV